MRKVKEVIIVEGIHDLSFLNSFIDADIIYTNGLGLNEKTKQSILELKKNGREFIVLTDPDYPGEVIRRQIIKLVPNCKHAFINKDTAISKNKKKIGVEHSKKEEVFKALENTISYEEIKQNITLEDFYDLELLGKENSKHLRNKVSDVFCLGYGSAKTILKKINMLQITKEELAEKIKEIKNGKNCNS